MTLLIVGVLCFLAGGSCGLVLGALLCAAGRDDCLL